MSKLCNNNNNNNNNNNEKIGNEFFYTMCILLRTHILKHSGKIYKKNLENNANPNFYTYN